MSDHARTPFSLSGQQALVIGGNSGIGLGSATGMVNAGASVFVVGRNQEKLDLTQAALGALVSGDQKVQTYQADVSDFGQLRAVITQVLAHHGHLDILVNSQGINQLKAAEEFTVEEYSRIMQTNLQSVFFFVHRDRPTHARSRTWQHYQYRVAGESSRVAAGGCLRNEQSGRALADANAGGRMGGTRCARERDFARLFRH